jgi:hypothetical protein
VLEVAVIDTQSLRVMAAISVWGWRVWFLLRLTNEKAALCCGLVCELN